MRTAGTNISTNNSCCCHKRAHTHTQTHLFSVYIFWGEGDQINNKNYIDENSYNMFTNKNLVNF